MIDFTLFDKALKITWVKRLCSDDNRPWKLIPLSLLSNLGGKLLFYCNYNIKYLPINEHLPKFYQDIISYWQEINSSTPKVKEEIMNQIIWNNRFIQINKNSIFFPNWNKAGIEKLSCLVNEARNSFISFNAFLQKYKVQCNFLQYYGLLSAIPQNWKNIVKQRQLPHASTNTAPEIEKLTCKAAYNTLITSQCFPPPTAEKRLIEHGFDMQERKKIYFLPFRVTKEVKLSVFQYKIVHSILYTNKNLHKMKKKDNPYCPFCPGVEHTITHLFFSCSVAVSFWTEFSCWYHSVCKNKLVLTKKEIICGVLTDSPSCLTLNHLILIGKYFLYINALEDKKYQFTDFIMLVKEKIDIEKYIAVMSNNRTAFEKKWSLFIT